MYLLRLNRQRELVTMIWSIIEVVRWPKKVGLEFSTLKRVEERKKSDKFGESPKGKCLALQSPKMMAL